MPKTWSILLNVLCELEKMHILLLLDGVLNINYIDVIDRVAQIFHINTNFLSTCSLIYQEVAPEIF